MEEELKKYSNWLWDMNRLRINSQIPGIRNADEMVDTYLASVGKKESTELSNCNKTAVSKCGGFEREPAVCPHNNIGEHSYDDKCTCLDCGRIFLRAN